MTLLQVIFDEAAGWAVLLAIALGPGVVAAVLWSPFLAAGRVRSLFRSLPPGDSLLVSYPAALIGASVPYVVGVVAALVRTTDTTGATTANAILDVIVPVSFGFVVGVPALACAGLPRLGVDWDPTGYGPGTWALLAAGGVWYAAVFAVPLFLVAIVMAMPT